MQELISIIIPVYNAEKYLAESIESILNQNYQNIELILVNDGSSDSSGEICDRYQKKDSRVIVIHKKNEGVSIARNTGIEKSSGTFIGFVDSDDLVHLDTFEILYHKMVEHPEVQFVTFIPRMVYSKEKEILPISQEESEIVYEGSEYRRLLYLEKTNVACWSKLFRSDFLKKFQFPEHKVNEDFYLLYQMTKKDIHVLSINNVLYDYMIREGSLSSIHSSRKDAVENALECMQCEEKEHGIIEESAALFFIQCDYYFEKLLAENLVRENRTFLKQVKKQLRIRLLKIWKNQYLYGKQKIRLIKNGFLY